MLTLTQDESRVLGVLIEKAQTTPAQYPISLNGLTVGCNQKNARDPVTDLSEEQVFDAVDKLRRVGLAREVMLGGSRVQKFRHVAREVLQVSTEELVLLAELLLRGPQSIGELRGRASRMAPLGPIEEVEKLLEGLAARTEPLVRELHTTRTRRFAQNLCPDLHPEGPAAHDAGAEPPAAPSVGTAPAASRLDAIEEELKVIRRAVSKLAQRLGEPDPF